MKIQRNVGLVVAGALVALLAVAGNELHASVSSVRAPGSVKGTVRIFQPAAGVPNGASYVVPAKRTLVITDIIISNPGNVERSVVLGKDAFGGQDMMHPVVVGPAPSNLSRFQHSFNTGIEFFAGESVVLRTENSQTSEVAFTMVGYLKK